MTRRGLADDIWRACDVMRRDDNCSGVMEYLEHLSWILFLRFLDEQEEVFRQHARLANARYSPILRDEYRWSSWVPAALQEPSRDSVSLTGFVRNGLIPYLASLDGSAERRLVSEIFGSGNLAICSSDDNLRDVLRVVDSIDFRNLDDIHTVSYIYEQLLHRLGRENRVAGEFYTPRPVIRFLVQLIDPRPDEEVYDPACGTCGFLVEAFEHMRRVPSADGHQVSRSVSLHGREKKRIPALLGTMNLILHGVPTGKIYRGNTLEEDLDGRIDRHDVILTNPPFGGTENQLIQQNFPVRAASTELLFLQHVMAKLKPSKSARCGMVVPEGTLFRSGPFIAVKRRLLESCSLLMVASLPPGTFAPYSDVRTALLLFDQGGPTTEVLYYELPLPANLKKFSLTHPIADEHFADAREVWAQWRAYRNGNGPRPNPTASSWIETAEALADRNYDLAPRNPLVKSNGASQSAVQLTASLLTRNTELQERLARLHALTRNSEP